MGKLHGVIPAPAFASPIRPKKYISQILVIVLPVNCRYQEHITQLK